ncbi:hypothetical protein GCM10007036_34230 [Alsobacter metallidurans]|uniref:Flagellar motility protein MotE (MotC chaperone) n=1 Tax=Alsobacter metallidurans TaxID=340221 RepID=A0A917MIK0_9HYPH|nr:hypothetical protein [Alsobacter metallidurans]GGH26439.1 hypothetical protein GCM10007036_34230 [Alsobacter metallidurans]
MGPFVSLAARRRNGSDLKLRLLPAVAGAAAALLLIKMIDASTQVPGPSPLAQASSAAVAGARNALKDPETTGSTAPAKKKDEKAEKTDKADPAAAPKAGAVELDQPVPMSPAEKSLLQRLGERREQLDDRQRELDTRENLLKAADKKIEARINELKELEGKSAASEDGAQPGAAPADPAAPAKPPSAAAGLKNLVTMYEAMKPKDAAKVFDRLDLKVLVPVVNAMNPRKMSEVLAAMSPEAAEKLTVELARPSLRTAAPMQPGRDAALPAGELPAIEPRRN